MRACFAAAIGVALFCIFGVQGTKPTFVQTQPEVPVIGIMTDPLVECTPPPPGLPATSCVESFYVRWLENAGIRVVPVPWNATKEQHLWWAKRINGILFPGGDLGGEVLSQYFSHAQRFYNWAVEWAEQGDPFFVWGTCMGFQIVSSCAAGTLQAITGPYPGMDPLMMSINFTAAQPTSKMFGDAVCPARVLNALSNELTTLNWHSYIISPDNWQLYPSMSAVQAISTNNVPGTNTVFVSSIEGRKANVFATQFHPERPPYEFSDVHISHTPDTLAVSQYLADFIASRLKLNNHTFDSAGQLENATVSHWPLVDHGLGHRLYYLNDSLIPQGE